MESRKMDRGCTKTPPPHPVPVIMALPVQLSPHGTLRVPSNEYVLVHRTDSGNIQVGNVLNYTAFLCYYCIIFCRNRVPFRINLVLGSAKFNK